MAVALLNAVNFLNNFSRPLIWSRNHCFIDLRADANWQNFDRYYLEIVLQVTPTAPGLMPVGVASHPQPNYTLTAAPDADGVVRFEFARILNDYPFTHLPAPEFGEDTCGLWRLPEWEMTIFKNINSVRTQVMQNEIPSLNFEGKYTFNVLGAGLDRESFAYPNQDDWLYDSKKQLTSAADPKMSHQKAEEFLYYYPAFANLSSVDVNVTLHRPDGSEESFTLFAAQDCYQPCVFFAPTSYKVISTILNDTNFLAWDVWFESAASPITGRVSELFRYELPDQPCREPRIFYSKNSLGGWDTTVFLGDNQNTINSDFETAHIFENYNYSLKDFQQKTFAQRGSRDGEAFTHWLTKRQADALQDFAISKAIILQDWEREILTPVAAENINFDYRFKEQNLVGFQFFYTHANRVPLYTRFVKRPEDTVVEPPPAVLEGVGLFVIHHILPNRLEVVGKVPFGVQSVFALNGFAGQSSASDYYFKLIPATGDPDPLNPAFGAAPALTFADLQAQSAPALEDKYLLCGLDGFSLPDQTDLVAVIQFAMQSTPPASSNVELTIPLENAFSDVMVTPQVQMLYNSLGGAGLEVFSKSREAGMLAASSPLVEYEPGLTGIAIANIDKAQHFHLMNTAARPRTANLITSTTAADESLIGVACPLVAKFAPFTSNPAAVEFDQVNDQCKLLNFTDREPFDFALIPNGKWLIHKATFTFRPSGFGAWRTIGYGALGDIHQSFAVANTTASFSIFQNTGGANAKSIGINYTFIPNQAYTIQAYIKKLGNNGTAQDSFDFNSSFFIVNGRKITNLVTFTSGNFVMPSISTLANEQLWLGGNPQSFSSNFTIRKLQNIGYSILDAPDSAKDQRRYAINPRPEIQKMQYAWDFASLTASGVIPPVGTIAHGNAQMFNHTNLTTPLF